MLMTQTFGVAHLAAQSTADGIAKLEQKAISKTGFVTKEGELYHPTQDEMDKWPAFRSELTNETQAQMRTKLARLKASKLKFNFNTK